MTYHRFFNIHSNREFLREYAKCELITKQFVVPRGDFPMENDFPTENRPWRASRDFQLEIVVGERLGRRLWRCHIIQFKKYTRYELFFKVNCDSTVQILETCVTYEGQFMSGKINLRHSTMKSARLLQQHCPCRWHGLLCRCIGLQHRLLWVVCSYVNRIFWFISCRLRKKPLNIARFYLEQVRWI